MEELSADFDFMPTFHSTPQIASQFNGWHYKDMREAIPFVRELDDDPPDIIEMLLLER